MTGWGTSLLPRYFNLTSSLVCGWLKVSSLLSYGNNRTEQAGASQLSHSANQNTVNRHVHKQQSDLRRHCFSRFFCQKCFIIWTRYMTCILSSFHAFQTTKSYHTYCNTFDIIEFTSNIVSNSSDNNWLPVLKISVKERLCYWKKQSKNKCIKLS